MSRSPTPILLVLALAALAGCLGNSLSDPLGGSSPSPLGPFAHETSSDRLPVPSFDFTHAIDPDHGGSLYGHALPELHTGSFGLRLVGYNPLTRPQGGDSPADQGTSFIAMDTWRNYVCVAQYHGAGGAVIVDIQDPAKPTVVSSVPSGMWNSDCQFTDDGKFLLVAAYTGVQPGVPGAPPPLGDALAEGVLVFDVSDKAQPRFLFHDSQGAGPNGYHNVFTAQINGTHYVFQTYTGNILALDPGAKQLRPVGQVARADHDIWVGSHPLTGRWIMITGNARGTVIYDVQDPAHPVPLGAWEAHDGLTGWHRQWPLLTTVNGHCLMVVAGEFDDGFYTVLDFTDPQDLVEYGHWRIPGNPGFSPHEFETWDGYVVSGNYHAGVWLFDVGSPERADAPVTLGFYQPHENPYPAGGLWNKPGISNPNTWGAYFDERGYILAADGFSGLYVLSFDKTKAA